MKLKMMMKKSETTGCSTPYTKWHDDWHEVLHEEFHTPELHEIEFYHNAHHVTGFHMAYKAMSKEIEGKVVKGNAYGQKSTKITLGFAERPKEIYAWHGDGGITGILI